MDTYKRTGLVLAKGQGARVWDEAGAAYVDFASGIGVNSLGHGHPALVAAISAQASKLIHVSNYYDSGPALALSAELCGDAGYDAVFMCNSGTEANECAIKIARKRGNAARDGRSRIVTLVGSFHGRTMGALSATGQDKLHANFQPFLPGFAHVPPNDPAALDAALGADTCALFLEPILGEGGVIPLSVEYLRVAARLCSERGILLVADEVQSGVGRTGTLLASEQAGVKPDLVLLAKGLAGGIPIGAVLACGEAASVLGRGDHGSTFGGGPLATAAARVVLSTLRQPGFLDAVKAKGERISRTVSSWNIPIVKEVRGRGLMQGVVVAVPPDKIKALCLERGLLVLTAGEDAVRLLPPLVIGEAEIDEGLAALRSALEAAV